jgi:hypothetical protein
MINTEQLKRNYAAMPDEKLMHFAATEKAGLTKDARAILLREIESRSLDVTILDPSEAELNYDRERHWFFALDEKRKGADNDSIFRKLVAGNVTEEHAALIIKCLPEIFHSDEPFEDFIKNQCEKTVFAVNVGRLIIIGFCILGISYGVSNGSWPSIAAGSILLLPGIYFFFRSHSFGGKFWLETFKTMPENIVWIKPITVKHTIWYVVTLYKTYHFQIYTRDNRSVAIDCNSDENQQVFFEGIKKYIPHAHIGYSLDIEEMYERSPEDFINALQYEHVYAPIGEIHLTK